MEVSTSHFAVAKYSVLHFNILWKTCSTGKTLLRDDGSGDEFGHDSFLLQNWMCQSTTYATHRSTSCSAPLETGTQQYRREILMGKLRDAFTFRHNGCASVHVFQRRFGFRVYDASLASQGIQKYILFMNLFYYFCQRFNKLALEMSQIWDGACSLSPENVCCFLVKSEKKPEQWQATWKMLSNFYRNEFCQTWHATNTPQFEQRLN